MYCNKCGKQVPEESNFCLRCGTNLSAAREPEKKREEEPPAETEEEDFSSMQKIAVLSKEEITAAEKKSPGSDTQRKKADDRERALWEGAYSGKSLAPWYGVYVACAIFTIYGYSNWVTDKNWTTHLFFGGIVVVPLLILMFLEWVRKAGTRYKLTSRRLLVRRGVLSRKVEEIQLVRVDDVEAEQSFLNRIFHVGNVIVISTDSTTPRLVIRGVDNPMGLMETIRSQVDRARKRTLTIDSV